MAIGTLSVAAPTVAAAFGLYLFDKHHSNTKEHGGAWRASVVSLVAEVKEEVKSSRMPKLAPQFDGLHSFESLVAP